MQLNSLSMKCVHALAYRAGVPKGAPESECYTLAIVQRGAVYDLGNSRQGEEAMSIPSSPIVNSFNRNSSLFQILFYF